MALVIDEIEERMVQLDDILPDGHNDLNGMPCG